jgi:hypothetical protein
VISVDTKKKELVGDFKNGGREWQLKGEPERAVKQAAARRLRFGARHSSSGRPDHPGFRPAAPTIA